jgi:hypothetical protein
MLIFFVHGLFPIQILLVVCTSTSRPRQLHFFRFGFGSSFFWCGSIFIQDQFKENMGKMLCD